MLPTDIVGIVVFNKFAVKIASGHLHGSDYAGNKTNKMLSYRRETALQGAL